MSRLWKGIWLTLSIAALVLLGSTREFIFVNINYQLKYLYYEQTQSYAHSFFDFLNDYDYGTIYYSKWWLMAVFTVLFWVVSAIIIWLVRPQRKWFLLISGFYGLLIAIAGLCFLFGWLFGDINGGYAIARQILGVAHSPLPVMILIPALLFLLPEK